MIAEADDAALLFRAFPWRVLFWLPALWKRRHVGSSAADRLRRDSRARCLLPRLSAAATARDGVWPSPPLAVEFEARLLDPVDCERRNAFADQRLDGGYGLAVFRNREHEGAAL